MAETKHGALAALEQFVRAYQAKYPKAVGCLTKDREGMVLFFDLPAEHWTHVRSNKVIGSTFATIRHRTDRTNGCLTRTWMLSMLFKLAMVAEPSWRRLRRFAMARQGNSWG